MAISHVHEPEIARLHMRLPADAKERIEQAAVLSGLTLTDFAIHTLLRSADEVLTRHQTRTLSDRDRDAFLALLESDAAPNDALQKAVRAYKAHFGPKKSKG
jgi:uncharacterized protein (DUF1778 family)